MIYLTRPIIFFYQKNRPLLERLIVAAGLAVIFWLTCHALPGYSAEWCGVITIAILGLGFWDTQWSYYLATITLIYPIYRLSPYLMALFIALTILPRRVIIPNLDKIVLFILTPILAWGRLEILPLLLAGLFWGETAGAWVGMLSAFWFKLLGGMSGREIDLLTLGSYPITVAGIFDRFHDVKSLQTLQLLIEPFTTNSLHGEPLPASTVLLFHILQILLWTMAGYAVGRIARVRRFEGAYGYLYCLMIGALILMGGYIGLPLWLQAEGPRTDIQWYSNIPLLAHSRAINIIPHPIFLIGAVVSWNVLVGANFYILRRTLRSPIAYRRRAPEFVKRETSSPPRQPEEGLSAWRAAHSQSPNPSSDEEDIIMLELD